MAFTERQTRIIEQLTRLMSRSHHANLRDEALAAIDLEPTVIELYGFAAHAYRQLNDFPRAWELAERGYRLDSTNLFVLNRLTLAGNLTGRFEQVIAAAATALERVPKTKEDRLNLSIIVTNAIYAYSHLDRIGDAVTALSPVIERLDANDLHFNSACLYSRARDERAFVYMRKSLIAGKDKQSFADADFDHVREDPRFDALLAREWELEKQALARARVSDRAELTPEDFLNSARFRTEPAPDEPRDAALESAFEEPSSSMVYSDWLIERGHPRGELIARARRCELATAEDDRMAAYGAWAHWFELHAGTFLGPLLAFRDTHTRAKWRRGFVDELTFDIGYDGEPTLLERFPDVLRHPSLRFLRSLQLGDVPAEEQLDYADLVSELCSLAPRHLRELSIGPRAYQLSWTNLPIVGLDEALPQLRSLSLRAGHFELGRLRFPNLTHFALRTGGLTSAALRQVLESHWPLLSSLELWFGNPEYGASEFHVDELDALTTFAGLRDLRLRNAEFTDDIVGWLLRGPVLPRLERLDLSMGTLSNVGADLILANHERFAHLVTLNVDDNALSDAALESLKAALPNLSTTSQKEGRYVSVGE